MNEDTKNLFSVAVGKRRNRYYMDRFTKFASKGVIAPSWNWACFFFGWFWFLYRKMPLACLAYVAVLYVLYVILFSLLSDISAQYGFLLFYFACMPAYVNNLYYLILRNRIKRLIAKGYEFNDIEKIISSEFGTISDPSDKNPKLL